MTKFRPCIDLHGGKVKQIVGATLTDSGAGPKTNFVASLPAAHYARLYREHGLAGGHVIMLGKGNEAEAKAALRAYPGGLQVGGGITPGNAEEFLAAGASHVIVTSFIFEGGNLSEGRLREISGAVGRERLVLDLSCKRTLQGWNVATNRWQTITKTELSKETLEHLAEFCSEFLIHAADVEGRQGGMDEELIRRLAEWSRVKATYAGGARSVMDLYRTRELSGGKVDLTIGSALDIFGGKGIKFNECIAFNQEQ